MCVIERFNLIHPNGAPERQENLLHCQLGSPVTPCNNTRIQLLPDYFLPRPESAFIAPQHEAPGASRVLPGRHEETRRLKKFSNDLKLVWDFHIPFTSRKPAKKKRSTSEHAFVRRRESQRRRDVQHPPRVEPPMARPFDWLPQGRREVVQVPDRPQQHAIHGAEPHIIRPRRNHPLNVQIHNAEDSLSPSPTTPLREHRRHHSRTISEIQRYEELKRIVREREGREHAERQRRESAERDAREAVEARRRAEWEADRVRRENEELVRQQRRRLDREERLRALETERQRQEEEELRCQERERRRQERDEIRERRIRLDERRRIESVHAERRREEQEELERERARISQEAEDRQRLQEAAARDRIRRDRNERDRIQRQRRAGIPHRPRHETEVHHRPNVSFDERGDQVIDDAIRAENRRWLDARAPVPITGWARRRDVDGELRRRDTIAATQRRIYEDDRTRGGRRWV